MIKTDYFSHEFAYQKLKKSNSFGWDTEESSNDFIQIIENFLDNKALLTKGKILELGCGNGKVIKYFAHKGAEGFGIDVSPTAIEWANEDKEDLDINFQVGDVTRLTNYQDNVFDLLIDAHCYHCIIGEDRVHFINSAYRVLKNNGFLLIASMCGDVTFSHPNSTFDPILKCLINPGGVANRYIGLKEDLLQEIENSPFTLIKWQIVERIEPDEQDMFYALLMK